jgi:hypothetical protein
MEQNVNDLSKEIYADFLAVGKGTMDLKEAKERGKQHDKIIKANMKKLAQSRLTGKPEHIPFWDVDYCKYKKGSKNGKEI